MEIVYSQTRERARWQEASDRELLAGLRQGEEEAFAALIGRKTRPLLQLVQRLVGDAEEARDLVQMTFVRAWESRERYDERWSPNTWLYRIATNLAIDCLRGRGARHRASEPAERHLVRAAEERAQRDIAHLEHREVASIFRELAATLSPQQRAVFLLREVEGLSSEEVGKILGCRESTVRNHLFHARRHLRRELAERYPEYAGRLGAAMESVDELS